MLISILTARSQNWVHTHPRLILLTFSSLLSLWISYLFLVGLISTPACKIYQPEQVTDTATDGEKAAILAKGVTWALEEQLDSFFGFLPNDLFFVPRILDNTPNFQKGVIYATRPLSDTVSKVAARYGLNDTLNKLLVDASTRDFAYSEQVWGFWILYAAEGKYRQGINNWQMWAKNVSQGKKDAIYNLKSNDVHEILRQCVALCDLGLGILNSKMDHFDTDDNIYFVKGICAVIANVFNALNAIDYQIMNRGGNQTTNEAIARLSYIARFNPVYVSDDSDIVGDSFMPNHIAALSQHLNITRNRLEDIQRTMEK